MHTLRRDFLAGLGGLAFGIAGTGMAGAGPEREIPELPWPYVKLDAEETRIRGHLADYSTNCASGAYIAIIGQLREKVGFPYTLIPLDLYAYAGGGVNGWGTLCGSLNGAAGAITLAAGKRDQGRLVNELIGWYTGASLPSAESNRLAINGGFRVGKMSFGGELPSAVPGSPLCHVSIARWCKAAGLGAGTPERSERCARLCGDVAAKAVELLNAWKDGEFTPVFAPKKEITGCTSCHAPGKDAVKKQTSVGKMHCIDCHTPHQ
jgi:hypothetical protein